MISTILKARSVAITTISPDGYLLAACDEHNFLYIVEIETANILIEQELDYDLESLHFDRIGKCIFLNDGIILKVYSVPDFTELSLPAVDDLEDPTGLTFLDSQPSGEALLFLPTNGNLYHLDSLREHCRPIAFIPYDSISGQYLGQKFNKILLSALERSPRITIVSLEDNVCLYNIAPVSEWEDGELLAVAPNGQYALIQNNYLIIRDVRSNELSKWQLPSITPGHRCAISQNMNVFGLIDKQKKGVQLFDAITGQKEEFISTGIYEPISIMFFEQGNCKKLICPMVDGEVLLLTLN